MIKLIRAPKPAYLTPDKVLELTTRFKADKSKTVWKHEEIGTSLLESSSYKCAYCECKLQIADSYMQIEHFKDKDTYEDEVVEWENLLPSCQRCNRKKWTLDVLKFPIVNPYEDDPKNHLCLDTFRLYGKDEKGTTTITKLFLNDDERLVITRFNVSNEVGKQLTDMINNASNIDSVRTQMSNLLQLAQPKSQYSAFVATTLHSNHDYPILKDILEKNGVWDADLEDLHINSLCLVLDPR